jgi:hypothetical protein
MRAHRVIMGKHIGRELSPSEVVHHINGDKQDNRIENLQILQGPAEHSAIHRKDRRPKDAPADGLRRCVYCGKEITGRASKRFCNSTCRADHWVFRHVQRLTSPDGRMEITVKIK